MALLKVLLLLLGLGVSVKSDVSLQKRIIGGHNCDDMELLSDVRLEITLLSRRKVCGGSLIHPQWILSAVGCWPSYSVRNEITVRVFPRTGKSQVHKITYRPAQFYDVFKFSLLKLQKPVTSVPLAQLPDCSNRPKGADIVQLAGEGVMTIGPNNQHLHAVPVPKILGCVDMKVENVSPVWSREVYVMSAGEPIRPLCHGNLFEDMVLNGTIYGVISLVNHTLTVENKVQLWICDNVWGCNKGA